MSRPRLTISTFGDITIRVAPSGRFEARTRYRDWDGQTRQVQATGATARAAERSLKSKFTTRYLQQPTNPSLTPDSSFGDLATYWLEDKAGRSDRYWFWGVAGIVTLSSIGSIFSVAETLLAQLTNL